MQCLQCLPTLLLYRLMDPLSQRSHFIYRADSKWATLNWHNLATQTFQREQNLESFASSTNLLRLASKFRSKFTSIESKQTTIEPTGSCGARIQWQSAGCWLLLLLFGHQSHLILPFVACRKTNQSRPQSRLDKQKRQIARLHLLLCCLFAYFCRKSFSIELKQIRLTKQELLI